VLGLAVAALVALAGPASAITIKAGEFDFTLGDVVSVNFFHDRRDVGGYEGFFLTPAVNTSAGREGNFNVDAGQTRLSLSASGPGFWGGRTAGLVAFDFLKSAESGTTQNSLRMFYAWMQSEWASTPFGKLQIRIGQTETPLVSLIPDTVEDTPGFAFGTLYSREAQLRVWHTFGTTTNNLQFGWALSQPNSGVFGTGVTNVLGGNNRVGPAQRGEVPWFHGQVRLTTDLVGQSDLGPAFAAISGFIGRERFQPAETTLPGDENIRAWATQLAVNVPIIQAPGGKPQFGSLGLRGAVHIGENVDSYFGGGLQGVTVNAAETGLDAVQSKGAWLMARFFVDPKASVYVMGGYEEANHVNVVLVGVANDALVGGADTQNKVNRELLGGVDYRFSERVFTAIEYTYKESDFLTGGTGVNNRVLWSWKYFF
jgi:hypothetical protein